MKVGRGWNRASDSKRSGITRVPCYHFKVKRMIGWSLILVIVVALAMLGCKATRSGYESAPYRVVRGSGKFEVRDYSALTVVETLMVGSAANGGFNRLFRFITGGNEGQQKIAMTTPVFMSGSESNATMAFVMPAKLSASQVPKPSDASLKVRELPAGRFAVLRFSGGRNAENEADSLQRLEAWMKAEGLSVKSSPVYGYFDPPWTPAFLRRNEVMLRTDSGT
jgi:DNA gyrase inhibitor GyrI